MPGIAEYPKPSRIAGFLVAVLTLLLIGCAEETNVTKTPVPPPPPPPHTAE